MTTQSASEFDGLMRLGFSEEWFSLGLLAKEDIPELLRALDSGDDPNPEHYRWRVFASFLARQEMLAPELSRQLYTLGATDPDRAMGGSIMAAVLRRPECPSDLIIDASSSDRTHLLKIAKERME